MINRDRILEAAARVYAKHGFRGATTRLIAAEAGVNEVTLFRTFGSKAALLHAVVHAQSAIAHVPTLPDEPRDPAGELTAWCTTHLDHMRAMRSLMRQSMSELEERPEAASVACTGPTRAHAELRGYLERLAARGLVQGGADIPTALAMLMSALFGDAMGRDMMPDAFPTPAASAPEKYVACFLRVVGIPALGGGCGARVDSPNETSRPCVRVEEP